MNPVGKELKLCKVSFKMELIRANTKKIKKILKPYIPLDAGNPELCSIKMGCDPPTAHHAGLSVEGIAPFWSFKLL